MKNIGLKFWENLATFWNKKGFWNLLGNKKLTRNVKNFFFLISYFSYHFSLTSTPVGENLSDALPCKTPPSISSYILSSSTCFKSYCSKLLQRYFGVIFPFSQKSDKSFAKALIFLLVIIIFCGDSEDKEECCSFHFCLFLQTTFNILSFHLHFFFWYFFPKTWAAQHNFSEKFQKVLGRNTRCRCPSGETHSKTLRAFLDQF